MTSEIKTTTQNIGMLRQWINEDRIINNSEKTLISNEDIIHWLKWELPQQELKELTALATKAGVVIREAEIRDSQPKEGEKCSCNGLLPKANHVHTLATCYKYPQDNDVDTNEDSGMEWEKDYEGIWNYFGVEKEKNIKEMVKNLIRQLLASNTKETVTKIIKLVDEIEASHHDTSMDEWRLYKGVRNVIRDRFLDNLDNK